MIVSVKYRKNGEYAGRAYSYRTELPLKVGDIVQAPTTGGMKTAMVDRVNVPEAEVPAEWRDKLQEIVDFAPEGGDGNC